MELLFFARVMSNMAFVFFLGSYTSTLYGLESIAFPSYIIICVSTLLCYLFEKKLGEQRRFFPFALILLAFLFKPNLIEILMTVGGGLFAFFIVQKQSYASDHGDASILFKRNVIILIVLLLISGIFGTWGMVSRICIGYAMIYIISGISELSMLRHNDITINEKRFKVFNFFVLGLTCLLGFLMSSQWFMDGAAFALLWFYKIFVVPIILSLSYLTTGILWVLVNGTQKIFFPNAKFKGMPDLEAAMISGLDDNREGVPENPVSTIIMNILVGIIIILIIYLLIRKVINMRSSPRVQNYSEEREGISFIHKSDEAGLSGEVKGIRNTYRKFLKLMHSRGLNIFPSDTSLDIDNRLDPVMSDKSLASRMRELYIVARYSHKDVSKKDVDEVKHIYSQIKHKNPGKNAHD